MSKSKPNPDDGGFDLDAYERAYDAGLLQGIGELIRDKHRMLEETGPAEAEVHALEERIGAYNRSFVARLFRLIGRIRGRR
jgi:hypothetical protein